MNCQFGGEPLLYFKKTILPLSEKILDLTSKNGVNLSTGFTTNGLLIDDFFIVNAKKFNVSGLQITLDGHRERHNQVRFISKEKGSYDEILNKIKLCVFNDIYVTVRLNISEETLDNLNLICNDFLDINEFNKQFISFSFHEVWQNEKNLNSDISNIIDFYRENGFKCDHLLDSETALKNSCYADKFNQATINYNGDVFKCTARDFKSENREGILDSNGINWNEKFTKRIYETRFKNKPCLECKILPLCNGGCSQQRIENENMDYCIYNFDENLKIDVVKNKLKSRLYN